MTNTTTDKVKRVWTTYHPDRFTTTLEEKSQQFDDWLRDEKARAYTEGHRDAHAVYCPSTDANDPCPTNFEPLDNPYET